MFGRQANIACRFACSNPDCTGATDECKRIVADDLGGAFESKRDRVVGVGPNGAEFVGDAEDDTGGVGTICDEGKVFRQESELAVHTATREGLGYDLLSLDEAVDTQITPRYVEGLAVNILSLKEERSVGEVLEFSVVGIEFRDEFPWIGFETAFAQVELEVIAVGADESLAETGGFIAVGPVESRFKYCLLYTSPSPRD